VGRRDLGKHHKWRHRQEGQIEGLGHCRRKHDEPNVWNSPRNVQSQHKDETESSANHSDKGRPSQQGPRLRAGKEGLVKDDSNEESGRGDELKHGVLELGELCHLGLEVVEVVIEVRN